MYFLFSSPRFIDRRAQVDRLDGSLRAKLANQSAALAAWRMSHFCLDGVRVQAGRWLRATRILGCASLATMAACAGLPGDDGGAASQVSQYAGVDLPTAAGPQRQPTVPATSPTTSVDANSQQPQATSPSTAPSSSGGASAGTGPSSSANGDIATSASRTGVTLRLAGDHSKCVARSKSPPVAGSSVVLATCNGDARQNWMVQNEIVFANANFVMDVGSPPASFSVKGNPSSPVKFAFRSSGAAIDGSTGSGYPALQSGQTSIGTQLVASGTSSDCITLDLLGPGTGETGTLLALKGNASSCLTKAGSSVILRACDAGQSAQRWQYRGGCFYNDSGGTLDIDTRQSPPLPIMASGSCAAGVDWQLSNFGLYVFDSKSSNLYSLSGDTKQATLFFVQNDSRASGDFSVGGAWPP